MKNKLKNESSLRDLWDNMKHTMKHNAYQHLHYRGHRRQRQREREGVENIFDKIMAKNFPNLKKETDI